MGSLELQLQIPYLDLESGFLKQEELATRLEGLTEQQRGYIYHEFTKGNFHHLLEIAGYLSQEEIATLLIEEDLTDPDLKRRLLLKKHPQEKLTLFLETNPDFFLDTFQLDVYEYLKNIDQDRFFDEFYNKLSDDKKEALLKKYNFQHYEFNHGRIFSKIITTKIENIKNVRPQIKLFYEEVILGYKISVSVDTPYDGYYGLTDLSGEGIDTDFVHLLLSQIYAHRKTAPEEFLESPLYKEYIAEKERQEAIEQNQEMEGVIQDLLSKKLDLVEGIEKILNEEIFPSIQKETVKKLYLQFVYETLSKDELLYLLPILLGTVEKKTLLINIELKKSLEEKLSYEEKIDFVKKCTDLDFYMELLEIGSEDKYNIHLENYKNRTKGDLVETSTGSYDKKGRDLFNVIDFYDKQNDFIENFPEYYLKSNLDDHNTYYAAHNFCYGDVIRIYKNREKCGEKYIMLDEVLYHKLANGILVDLGCGYNIEFPLELAVQSNVKWYIGIDICNVCPGDLSENIKQIKEDLGTLDVQTKGRLISCDFDIFLSKFPYGKIPLHFMINGLELNPGAIESQMFRITQLTIPGSLILVGGTGNSRICMDKWIDFPYKRTSINSNFSGFTVYEKLSIGNINLKDE